jgi:glucose-1-phosphate thymidylyltransferase
MIKESEICVKGVILAGGKGSRLYPLTHVASKQLLPVYDKPLIFYPLSTLMLSGINKILIISSDEHINKFRDLLGDGDSFGVELSYEIQDKPLGIAQSISIAENFLAGEKCALILGDNIFHGAGLGRRLEEFQNVIGCQVFGYRVSDPSPYGIATIDERGVVLELEEKPSNFKSNIAIPGLYYFDETAVDKVKRLNPSARGELEIIDLLKQYLVNSDLKLEMLPRGTAWFDSGTFHDMYEASTYVKIMQERTGERVGDPEEISRIRGWIK